MEVDVFYKLVSEEITGVISPADNTSLELQCKSPESEKLRKTLHEYARYKNKHKKGWREDGEFSTTENVVISVLGFLFIMILVLRPELSLLVGKWLN